MIILKEYSIHSLFFSDFSHVENPFRNHSLNFL